MVKVKLTNRQEQILNLIKKGHCLPREIAFELKANKTNISTALKYLLDNELVVREKFYSTYIYALNDKMLNDLVLEKEKVYSKQMKFERDLFNRRKFLAEKLG